MCWPIVLTSALASAAHNLVRQTISTRLRLVLSSRSQPRVGVHKFLRGEKTMNYEAPRIEEVGSVADLTLGKPQWGPQRDNQQWWDFLGDPGSR